MKLIDMRQPNGELYPQSVFQAVTNGCILTARQHMIEVDCDLLELTGNSSYKVYTYADLEKMEDVEVITPARS